MSFTLNTGWLVLLHHRGRLSMLVQCECLPVFITRQKISKSVPSWESKVLSSEWAMFQDSLWMRMKGRKSSASGLSPNTSLQILEKKAWVSQSRRSIFTAGNKFHGLHRTHQQVTNRKLYATDCPLLKAMRCWCMLLQGLVERVQVPRLVTSC